MHSLKSIRLYFYSILKLFFLSFRNYYYTSSFYNKKLITFIPDRVFYNPSSYLSASLSNINSDFYKITSISPKLLWTASTKEKIKFDNLHSFLWLSKLDRKYSKKLTKDIIESWINNFFNYNYDTWQMEILAKRVISWVSNFDLTLEDADKIYKEKFFISLVKQTNFLVKNLNNLSYGSTKIICTAAIILSGMIFKENELNYKIGMRELEKIIKSYFNKDGFPKTRNPEEVFISTKYLILTREWLREAQKPIPDFLNEIIVRCGNCYAFLSSSSKQFPLFNGATEINHKDYDTFLKTLKYKFNSEKNEVADLIKIEKNKLEFFIDCGNPPGNNFAQNYQAGCLSFELISNKQKVFCNSGYGKYLSNKLKLLSCSTAAHSTLYINDTSSCKFQKNTSINKVFGNSLLKKHKILNKNYINEKDYYQVIASHNGFEKNFGYIHTRSIKILKHKDKIFGKDELKKTRKYFNSLYYFVRFHIYPNIKIVKTKAGNSILISLSNGEGWLLKSETNNLEIERNIFFGNKNKIINSESVLIKGNIDKDNMEIVWEIEKIK